jgi:hypothetical protein
MEAMGVTHYRSMFDNDYIGAWDLQGRDVVVTIAKVEARQLVGEGGRKARKPVLHFRGKKKTLAIGKTNAKVIARMYGPDTANWIGKQITLFPSQTEAGGETVDCVRVRPTVPAARPGQTEEEKETTEDESHDD